MTDGNVLASFVEEFLSVSRRRLQERRSRIDACLAMLSEGQIWSREHEVENAVGNLVLHLCGNVTQWLLGGVGGQTVSRDRDAEFRRRDRIPRAELVQTLQTVMARADAIVAGVTLDELGRVRTIQGYDVTGLEAIYVAVDHFAEHTGQIIWATKRMTGADLGFYASLQGGVNVTPGASP